MQKISWKDKVINMWVLLRTNRILQSIQMGMSHSQMLYSGTLTGRHHPCVKDCFQDVLSDVVGDKVKVQWVLAVKKNTFNQRHYVACRVILGTNDRNVYHLQKKIKYLHKTITFRSTWLQSSVTPNYIIVVHKIYFIMGQEACHRSVCVQIQIHRHQNLIIYSLANAILPWKFRTNIFGSEIFAQSC